MGRTGFWALCVLGLSACGGTTTTYAPNVYPSLSGSLSGKTFAVTQSARTVSGGNSGSVADHTSVSIQFTSADTVDVMVDGNPIGTLTRVGNAPFTGGTNTMSYAATATGGSTVASNMLTFTLNEPGFVETFIGGNPTRVSDRPQNVTAVYTGVVTTRDGAGAIMTGAISLTADFSNATVSGTMSNVLAAAPTAVFDFSGAPITSAGFSTFVISTTSPGVTMTGTPGAVQGNFFGPGGKEAGGVVRIRTTSGNAAGTFGAVTP